MLSASISVHAHVWSVRVYLRVFEPAISFQKCLRISKGICKSRFLQSEACVGVVLRLDVNLSGRDVCADLSVRKADWRGSLLSQGIGFGRAVVLVFLYPLLVRVDLPSGWCSWEDGVKARGFQVDEAHGVALEVYQRWRSNYFLRANTIYFYFGGNFSALISIVKDIIYRFRALPENYSALFL